MDRFTGAVLTGGASTRMGTDKALLPVGGRPMAGISADALLAAGAAEVFCIGGDGPALGRHGLEVRPDRYPGQGPFGATVTALREAAHELVVVLTCDLPYITDVEVRTVVDALIAARREVAVAAPLVEGRPQFLTAAYRRSLSLGVLAAAFEGGERAVRRGASGLRWVGVEGLDLDHLRDADRPEDVPLRHGRQRS